MGKVLAGLTVSLDGYTAGPNDGPGNPLGDGGGVRLFGELEQPVALELRRLVESDGVTHLRYCVKG